MPFALNVIVLANSRATMMGLVGVGLASIFLFKGKTRAWVIMGMIVVGILFFSLTNEQYWETQSTIQSYEKESSAMSRIYIWKGAMEMFSDHPFGVGGEGFSFLFQSYIDYIKEGKSQHNTFVAVLTDWGFIGIILYLGFLIHSFKVLFEVKRRARIFPELYHYHLEATAVQLAFIGILVAGIFHSRQYAEIVYWISAFAVMLKNNQSSELAELEPADSSDSLVESGRANYPISEKLNT